MIEDFLTRSHEKLYYYKSTKTKITFRLNNYPNYFYSGIIENIYLDYALVLKLDNGESAYFYLNEISIDSIHPSSYNPIRYFLRQQITEELRDFIFARDNYECKLKLDGCILKAECCDHIIPVCQGGLTIKENLQASCIKCNLKKGSNLMI
jgi:hypothetical protein